MRLRLLHAGELLLCAVLIFVSVEVSDTDLYMAFACPCLVAAAVFGWFEARTRR